MKNRIFFVRGFVFQKNEFQMKNEFKKIKKGHRGWNFCLYRQMCRLVLFDNRFVNVTSVGNIVHRSARWPKLFCGKWPSSSRERSFQRKNLTFPLWLIFAFFFFFLFFCRIINRLIVPEFWNLEFWKNADYGMRATRKRNIRNILRKYL